MRLALFDIDGTLVDTGGAGKRALSSALEEVLGIEDALGQIRLDGKTDWLIVREALEQAGIPGPVSEADRATVLQRYVELLRNELSQPQDGFKIYPGVRDLLWELAGDAEFVVGLATGNIEEGARVKLTPGELNGFFSFGGFGCDGEDRTQLIQKAIERGIEINDGRPFKEIFVIGDTPRDVEHGQRAGAKVIAVATGHYSVQELNDCGADLVVDVLSPRNRLLSFLRGQETP